MDPVTILRDVLHESLYNQCNNSSDTCDTREPARELFEVLSSGNPDSFEIWHQKWYTWGARRYKPSVKQLLLRRNHLWWHRKAD